MLDKNARVAFVKCAVQSNLDGNSKGGKLKFIHLPQDPSVVRYCGTHTFMAITSLLETRGRGSSNSLNTIVHLGSSGEGREGGGEGGREEGREGSRRGGREEGREGGGEGGRRGGREEGREGGGEGGRQGGRGREGTNERVREGEDK